jgi:glutamine amidotransferase
MIGIVDYGMGNLRSVYNAVVFLGYEARLVSKTEDFNGLSHLIIPGVGAFSPAMTNLQKAELIVPIKEFIATRKPVLGICLGMQLLASVGFEPNEMEGLNIIEGKVVKFQLDNQRIPHVGWNSIDLTREHYLFEGVKKGVDFYFVHSFYFDCKNDVDILAYCDYGKKFPAIVSKDNVTGIQFHPEKSQKNGLKILKNFCSRTDA